MNARHEEMLKTAAKRGTKRTCENDDCGRRFYDLNQLPMDCPYCGVLFAVPIKKPVDTRVYGARANYKTYKLIPAPVEPDETLPEAEVATVEIDDDETPEAASEEVLEIEEEEIDESLSVDIKDRGEQ